MKRANPIILVINGGSSSIKFALFEATEELTQILKGSIENIGTPKALFRVKGLKPTETLSMPVAAPHHTSAIELLTDWIEEHSGKPSAIGHRLVHGGSKYFKPERITTQMIEELRHLTPFDPEHLPEEIRLIEAFQQRFPEAEQIACFDTAFHHDLPRVAKVLPIPRRYEAQGVRRYGFHGLSYEFLMRELRRLDAATGRVILAHLGNGSSLAAIRDGKPIDTTMSFTPTAGVPMSTRSGDLDPSLSWYFAQIEGFSSGQFHKMVNFESGLLGISETSSDIRELLEREAHDVRAREAIDLFCYQTKKSIGAFAAALGGLDTLVFSGGIGENAPQIRSRICEGLEFLGIECGASSPVAVRVIPTNEEWMIAHTLLNLNKVLQ